MIKTTTPKPDCCADIVILGGGIAGLWLLNHLSARGFSVLLFESTALGNGQSVASQGIIHGGLKYALSGSLSEAANAIANMPSRWKACLNGDDPVNLSSCSLLSDHYYMWSEGSYRSRLKAFLGSKSLRGKVDVVAESDYPKQLISARGQGSLYRLPDFVIDTGELLFTLSAGYQKQIFKIDSTKIEFSVHDRQHQLIINTADAAIPVNAQRYIFTAGEGNAQLLETARLHTPAMQRRPLKMVILRKASLPRLFVHCIGDSFALTPRLTLTSHSCSNGDVAWYLGGELAEKGVARSDQDQIQHARQLLATLFPWIDLHGADWSCLSVNRAEGSEPGRHRPDSVFLSQQENILVAWPTKFTLSPALADEVCDDLARQGVTPALELSSHFLSSQLEKVTIASPPWEVCFGYT